MNKDMVVTVHTDGGARGNPGPAACAYVITDESGRQLVVGGKYLGVATNNEAEYWAVIESLLYLKANILGIGEVKFLLDSELVVKQLTGIYKVKHPRLRELVVRVRELEADLRPAKISYGHVVREKNKEADGEVNGILDQQA